MVFALLHSRELGLLSKIVPLLNKDFSRQMVLQCLVTITHHGGALEKKTIAEQCTAPLIQLIKDHFENRRVVELAVVTLGKEERSFLDAMLIEKQGMPFLHWLAETKIRRRRLILTFFAALISRMSWKLS